MRKNHPFYYIIIKPFFKIKLKIRIKKCKKNTHTHTQ